VMYRVTVTIEAPVEPTEVGERVADAVTALFPNADPDVSSDRVTATVHDLDGFRENLFEQEILDTARAEFERNREDGEFSFDLKKQAAFRGVVNFSVGKPDELGDIHVDVTVDEPSVEEFIAFLAPETKDGEPLG